MCSLWPTVRDFTVHASKQTGIGGVSFFAWRVQTNLLVNQPSVKLGQRSPLHTPKPVCPAWFHTSTQWPVNLTFKPLKEISWRRQGLKTHVCLYSGKKTKQKKKHHSHHIFHKFQTTERLPVCPHVLLKLFEVDLLHGCTLFFFLTSSPLRLLWSQCDYWMEAADVKQSHTLAEKTASEAICYLFKMSLCMSRWSN